MSFECEIISVSNILHQGPLDSLSLPGIEGEFTVLTNHSPMITLLGTGIVKAKYKEKTTYFTVSSGTVDVRPDKVIVLAGVAENVKDLNLDECTLAEENAKERMDAETSFSSDAYQKAKLDYTRAHNRVKAIKLYGVK